MFTSHRFAVLILLASLLALPAHATPLLVQADWLEPRLDDPAVVVVDLSQEDTQYQRFHLPGAVRLPYGALNTRSPAGVSLSIGPQRLAQLLGQLGIGRDTHVVAYDDVGGLNAARLVWELERLGHPRVSVLDGGLVRWILEGRKVSAAPASRKPVQYTVPTAPGRENLAHAADVAPATRQADSVVLDVRTEEEYRGSARERRSGHVPGARWFPWEQAVAFEEGFTLQPAARLQTLLAQVGLTDKQTPVVVYCRSGHRAAHTYFTLRQLGFERVKLYDGSMLDYAQQPALPLKLGDQP